MKISKTLTLALLAFSFFCLPASSEIYKWRDKHGNLVISNVPPPAGVKWEREKTQGNPQRPTSTAAADAKSDSQESEALKPYRDVKVTLYETDWCPYCRKAGEYLKSLGVNLIRWDIDKDPEKKAEKLRKAPGYTGVPLIDVDGIIIRGYGPEHIKEAVEKKRAE